MERNVRLEDSGYGEDLEFQALRDEICSLTGDLANYRVGMVAGVVALLAAGFACAANKAPLQGATVCLCAYAVVFLMHCVVFDRLRGISLLGAYLLVFYETAPDACARMACGEFPQDIRHLRWEARSRAVRHRVGRCTRHGCGAGRLVERAVYGGYRHMECACLAMISLAALFCLTGASPADASAAVAAMLAIAGLVPGLGGLSSSP